MIKHFDEIDSTNNWLKVQLQTDSSLPEYLTAVADYQTAGRGQAGNGWESERAKNLLFSTLVYPKELRAAEQFRLTEWVSVAVRQSLAEFGIDAKIKWPNDIYVGDKKLCGMLLENVLEADRIGSCVVGIGLNVNQTVFRSAAPNPVSIKQVTGKDTERESLLNTFIVHLRQLRPLLCKPQELHDLYMSNLYRRKGFYWYRERSVSSAPTNIATEKQSSDFEATVVDVDNAGRLQLKLRDESIKTYHFKQIRYVID